MSDKKTDKEPIPPPGPKPIVVRESRIPLTDKPPKPIPRPTPISEEKKG